MRQPFTFFTFQISISLMLALTENLLHTRDQPLKPVSSTAMVVLYAGVLVGLLSCVVSLPAT